MAGIVGANCMSDLVNVYLTVRTGCDGIAKKVVREFNNVTDLVFVRNRKDSKIYLHVTAIINPKKKSKFKNDLEKKLKRTVRIIGIGELSERKT